MRKFIYLLLVAFVFAGTSCNKCYECNFGTVENPDVRELCKNSFYGDKSLFEESIKEYQLAGYECIKK